jgi:hypothetical protein
LKAELFASCPLGSFVIWSVGSFAIWSLGSFAIWSLGSFAIWSLGSLVKNRRTLSQLTNIQQSIKPKNLQIKFNFPKTNSKQSVSKKTHVKKDD